MGRFQQMLILCIGLAFLGVNLPPVAHSGSSKSDKQIWAGQSGGFRIRWSTGDLLVSDPDDTKDVRYSAKAHSLQDLERTRNSENEPSQVKNPLTLYERDFTLLSVVGPILSFQEHYYASFTREAHPAGETRYTAINLANGGEPAKLTDFSAEADILAALLEDPLIREAFASSKQVSEPKTLPELITTLSSGELRSEKYCYSVTEDVLSRFAFHHIEDNKVAVRIGLSGMGPCRELLTSIGLLLPMPDALRTALSRASSRTEGFLMKDHKKIARQQKTTFRFVPRNGIQK